MQQQRCHLFVDQWSLNGGVCAPQAGCQHRPFVFGSVDAQALLFDCCRAGSDLSAFRKVLDVNIRQFAARFSERLTTGGYILHSGLEKWRGDEGTAKGIHGMAAGAYPFPLQG